MFNLEQCISEWRGQMLSAGVRNPDIVDELESHLREDWARRVQSGESEEQAFEGAVQGVGQASFQSQEFPFPQCQLLLARGSNSDHAQLLLYAGRRSQADCIGSIEPGRVSRGGGIASLGGVGVSTRFSEAAVSI